MENAFAHIPGVTTREQVFLQFVSRIALHAEVDESEVEAAGFEPGQIQAVREAVLQFERGSSSGNPTLSSLLAKTLRSTCCS